MNKIILIMLFCTFNYLYSYSVAEEEFLSYVSKGNAKEVLNYINNKKVDINTQDKRGLTFLMISILQKQNKISKILIENGSDINLKDNLGLTALAYALLYNNFEISKILIDNNANINTRITIRTGYIDVKNVTILMIARDVEVVKKLIEAGAKLDERADFSAYMENMPLINITALILAIVNDNTEKAEFLIKSGANVNIKDGMGKTPLYYARLKNNTKNRTNAHRIWS